MKITTEVMHCGVPNKLGVTYPTHIVRDAAQKYLSSGAKLVSIEVSNHGDSITDRVYGICESISVDDTGLVAASITLLDTEAGRIAKNLVAIDNTSFAFSGIGVLDDGQTIIEYNIINIGLVFDHASL